MDWSAPYRADVEACCQTAWRLGREVDAQRLPAALEQTCRALQRWILLPVHLPENRQRLLTLLARLEQLCLRVAQAAKQPAILVTLCTQMHHVILELQHYL